MYIEFEAGIKVQRYPSHSLRWKPWPAGIQLEHDRSFRSSVLPDMGYSVESRMTEIDFGEDRDEGDRLQCRDTPTVMRRVEALDGLYSPHFPPDLALSRPDIIRIIKVWRFTLNLVKNASFEASSSASALHTTVRKWTRQPPQPTA